MIRFKVNGKEQTFDGDPDMPLLWYLTLQKRHWMLLRQIGC